MMPPIKSCVSGEGVCLVGGGGRLASVESIWVGGREGLGKYTRGVKDNFEVSGLDGNWGERINIYTDEEAERLYVLDMANQRVLAVVKETGEDVEQWRGDKIGEGTGGGVGGGEKKK